jgi:hypothetical protein
MILLNYFTLYPIAPPIAPPLTDETCWFAENVWYGDAMAL